MWDWAWVYRNAFQAVSVNSQTTGDLHSKNRCFGSNNLLYANYHDTEWGIPVHDDNILFEQLSLEGAQAGLSWETILKKRQGYRDAFHNFNVQSVSSMTNNDLDKLCQTPSIVRHKLKIYSVRQNALVFQDIQKECGSFDTYVWSFVGGIPIINNWETASDIPTTTPESDALSKDLKKRGMSFVGSTIIYAFMQATGLVDDHLTTCWKRSLLGHH